MDLATPREIAGFLALAGTLGVVAMVLYISALARVDWDLIPASALRRVRWWSAHASLVLRLSLLMAILGLTMLGLIDLGGLLSGHALL